MKHTTRRTTLTRLTVIGVFVLSGLLAPFAGAASPNQTASQALEIAPPVVPMSANPGETVKAQISLRDVSNGPLVVRGQVNDFVAAGEDGVPKLLLEEGDASPYSMKTWFGPLDVLTLESKQVENLTVTINVPKDAAPGGYYSVIRFTATPPDLDQSGVSLSASLGALILMQVKGEAKQEMKLEEFSTTQNGKNGTLFESTPINFVVRTKNTGNLHEQPVGQIKIKDMFGAEVANVNVNLERRNVLPGSIRRFDAPLDQAVIGTKILFGKYTADLTMKYADPEQSFTASLTFWVIPWKAILVGIALLIGLFFLLRFILKRYNEYIISKSSRRGGGRHR